MKRNHRRCEDGSSKLLSFGVANFLFSGIGSGNVQMRQTVLFATQGIQRFPRAALFPLRIKKRSLLQALRKCEYHTKDCGHHKKNIHFISLLILPRSCKLD